MQGWKLFRHAAGMIVRNWLEVLRIFLVPTLVGVAVVALTIGLTSPLVPSVPNQNPADTAFGVTFIAVLILSAVLTTWCIVAWHRFVILEEMPTGWIPAFNGGRILSYWGQALKLILVFLLLSVPIVAVVMLAAQVNVAIALVLGVPLYFWWMLLVMRLSITLPAAAVGRPLPFAEARSATKDTWGALLLLVLLLAGLQLLVQGAVAGLAQMSPALSLALNVAASVFLSLLNVSILTTLYGHYVEGRSID
jgi:hypothetical protein